MKQVWKRILAILLALCLISIDGGTMALRTYASESETSGTETSLSDSVSATAESAASSEAAALINEEVERQDGEYSIYDVTMDGNEGVVEYQVIEDAEIIVCIFTEDDLQLVASDNGIATSEGSYASVTFDAELPQYFRIRAYIVDPDTHVPLGDTYESSYYTEEMQDIVNSTVEDFDEEDVINLDTDNTTNFVVCSEDTVRADSESGYNQVTANGDGTYIFENADDTVKNLAVGDSFVYEDTEGNLTMIKVEDIVVSGDTVVLTEDEDVGFADFFDQVKLDTDFGESGIEYDDSTLDSHLEYTGCSTEEVSETDINPALDIIDYTPDKLEKKFNYDFLDKGFDTDDLYEEGEDKGAVSASVKVSGSISAALTGEFRLYVGTSEAYVQVKIEFNVTVNVSFEEKISISVPIGGFHLGGEILDCIEISLDCGPTFEAKVSAKIEVNGEFGFAIGSKWSTSGHTDLSKAPSTDLKIEAEGTVYVGLKAELKASLLGEGISLSGEAGVTVNLEGEDDLLSDDDSDEDAEEKHLCNFCLEGTVKVDINATFAINLHIKVAFFEKTFKESYELINKTIELDELKFYLSVDYDELGMGECPHKAYRVTATVLGEDTESESDSKLKSYIPLSGASISGSGTIDWSEEATEVSAPATDSDGESIFYLEDGTYSLQASCGEKYEKSSKTLTVSGKAKTIQFNLDAVEEETETETESESEEESETSSGTVDPSAGYGGAQGTWSLGTVTVMMENDGVYQYTGSAITPQITVIGYYSGGSKVLTEGTHYSISFDDNHTNIGIGYMTVTGLGTIEYDDGSSETLSGNAYLTFDIVGEIFVYLEQEEFEYTGSAITPAVHVIRDGEELTEGTDYSLTYADNVNPGYGMVYITTLTGTSETAELAFIIDDANTAMIVSDEEEAEAAETLEERLTDLAFICNTVEPTIEKLTEADEIDISDTDAENGNGSGNSSTGDSVGTGETSVPGDAESGNGSLTEGTENSDGSLTEGTESGETSLAEDIEAGETGLSEGASESDGASAEANTSGTGSASAGTNGDSADTNGSSTGANGASAGGSSNGTGDAVDGELELDLSGETLSGGTGSGTTDASEENSADTESSGAGSDSDSDGIIIETAADGLVALSTMGDAIEEIGTQTGSAFRKLNAYSGSGSSDGTTRTVTFRGLAAGVEHIVVAVIDPDASDLFAADNLLYIAQATADDYGELVLSYIPRVDTDHELRAYGVVPDALLSDAEITVTDLVYDGTQQAPDISIIYDGTTLTEGTDYTLTGDTAVTDAGDYEVTIIAKTSYYGQETVAFSVAQASQTMTAELSSTTLSVGETVSLNAAGIGTLTYSSGNESIATVSADGIITGVAAGTADITVTAAGDANYLADAVTVTITVESADSGDADGTDETDSSGGGDATGNTGNDSSGTGDASGNTTGSTGTGSSTGGTTDSQTGTGSQDNAGSTVDPATCSHSYGEWTVTKEATAVSEGTRQAVCSICGTVKVESIAKLQGFVTLNVTANSTVPLKVKQTTKAVKVMAYETGDSVVSWTSSNKKVATVSSSGKIKAKKKGTTTITVTMASGASTSFKIKVQKGTVKAKKITLSDKKLTIKKGKTVTLDYLVTPITCVQKVKFTSSNTKVATVTSKGKIKAKKAGKAKITIKIGTKKAVVTVTVK